MKKNANKQEKPVDVICEMRNACAESSFNPEAAIFGALGTMANNAVIKEREKETLAVASKFILDCARGAGQILMKYWQNIPEIRPKGCLDLVTTADLKSEQYIVKQIAKRFPGHAVDSEERGFTGEAEYEYKWTVDPLDGTLNYAHGVPFFNVSIALQNRNYLLLAAVYDPLRDEMFSASRGGHTLLNGKDIARWWTPGEPIRTLDRAVVGLSTHPLKLDEDMRDPYLAMLGRLGPRTQHLVNLGSQALMMAYVAAGRLDAAIAVPADPWSSPAYTLLHGTQRLEPCPISGAPWPESGALMAAGSRSLRNELSSLVCSASLYEVGKIRSLK